MRLGRDVLALDLYQVLDVGKDATNREIRAAYLGKVRASHPDLNPEDREASARTAQINVAGRVLLDPALRAFYDRARAQPGSPQKRRRPWYDRPQTRSNEDWTPPPRRPSKPPQGPAWAALRRELRGAVSRLSLALDEKLESMPHRARVATATLLLTAAFWLIASAKPRNLLAGPNPGSDRTQPTSVDPGVLNP